MPRSISVGFTRDLLDPNSDVPPLVFLKITSPDIVGSIRVVNDITKINNGAPVPYSLNSQFYTAYPFSLTLFNEVDTVSEAKLTIQNVDRLIGQAVESIPADRPLAFELSIYPSDDFALNIAGTAMEAVGTPSREYYCPQAFLRNVTWDGSSVSGSIRLLDPSKEPAVSIKCSPETAPGLFIT